MYVWCFYLGMVLVKMSEGYGYGGVQAQAMDQPQTCAAPPSTSSLFVQAGTRNTYLGKAKDPASLCSCDRGQELFYESSTERDADIAKKMGGQTAMSISTLSCDTFCVCDEDGKCYQPAEKNGYIDVVPFCDEGGCHAYAVPFTGESTSANVKYGPLMEWDTGNIFRPPGEKADGTSTLIGSTSGQIKAKSVGCESCSTFAAKQDKSVCAGNKDVCKTPEGKIGLWVASGTENSNNPKDHGRAMLESAKCSCDEGTKRFWSPSTEAVPKAAFLSSQMAWILDSTANCPDLCFCDSTDSQNCYVGQTNNTRVEILPYCDGTDCFMYAVVVDKLPDRDNLFDGVHSTLHNENFLAPDPRTEPVGPTSKYIKVTSISCQGCDKLRSQQCVGPAA